MTVPPPAPPGPHPGLRVHRLATTAFAPLLGLLMALTCAATPPKEATPPAPSSAASVPSTAAAAWRARLLPTVDEWIRTHGRPPTQTAAFPEELPLIAYTAPSVDVLAVDPRGGCPEPRDEPTFDVIFDRDGKVAAIQPTASMPCPPLADAWKDAIATWRLRDPDPLAPATPALIRITARLRRQPPSPPKTAMPPVASTDARPARRTPSP